MNRRQALASGVSAATVVAAPTSPPPARAPAPADRSSGGAPPDVFVEPLPGWRNLKADFGAIGDGRADDTAALQKALDALADSGSVCLYIPAGRYRITRTVILRRKGAREARGLNIQGEDPARTFLVWGGGPEGRMVEFGAWYSSLGRLTFDGRGQAAIGLAHGPEFVTANEIADCAFQDMGVGIEAGTPTRSGIAETSVVRCRFLRCSAAGASLRNFNSLDWWFHHCRFEDCQIGLTNLYGAGNFHAYDSVFLRSREADIAIRNTGFFGIRNNTSIGSKAFFVARAVEAAAEITFQRNRIIDAQDVAPVRIANLGPAIFLDNLFVSRPGQAGPIIEARSAIGVAVGNRFTAGQFAALKGGSTVLDNARVPRPSITPPTPVAAAPAYRGPVTSIAAGSGAAAIQAAIDAAARRGGGVIHFADGSHPIDRTLVLPANVDVRLVGPGINSAARLEWTGAGTGPMLRLLAPSRAQLHNLSLYGAERADGVDLPNLDAQGGVITLDQVKAQGCRQAGFEMAGLARTSVLLRDIDHAGCKVGMRITGAGPAKANAPVTIASGSSSGDELNYVLTDGARLVARDIWYESGSDPAYIRLTGDAQFTLNGSNIATPRRSDAPAVLVQGLRGQALFLGVMFSGHPDELPAVVAAGDEGRQDLLLLGVHGNGEYFSGRASAGRALRLHGLTYGEGGSARPLPDRGAADPDFIRRMLAPARMQEPRDQGPPRLYRVLLQGCRTGVRLGA